MEGGHKGYIGGHNNFRKALVGHGTKKVGKHCPRPLS